MEKSSSRYASIQNPTIAAIAHGMYRFASMEEAQEQLDQVAQHFVIPRKQPDDGTLVLWIKGFGLTDADAAAGVTGHYAAVSIVPAEERYMLCAAKIDVPAKDHPQRAQIKRPTPNWSHPALRAIRKKKIYDTPEAAQAELDLLHKDFPTVSIPNPGKLYIMIYCADRPSKNRMVKFKITIEPNEEKGGFQLKCVENTYKPRPKVASKQPPKEAPKGKFTAKVALARSKKKK